MAMTINGSGTITGLSAGGLPDATIQQADLATNVAGNGPAFSAYQSSTQTLSSATFTKIQFQSEEFDTNSNYDKDTNYRFQPTVAGYYQINAGFGVGSTSTQLVLVIYKNGSTYKSGANIPTAYNTTVSGLVYCNGSTDYIEIYGYFGTGQTVGGGGAVAYTYFQGALVRAA